MPAALLTDSRLRSEWIVGKRGPRNELDPEKAFAFLNETEPDGKGGLATIDTLFLTNKECPWKCVMCDLWKNTLEYSPAPGQIPLQIQKALLTLRQTDHRQADWIKLYNSGSFFDPNAIPETDHPTIADLVAGYQKVIVESHPAFIGPRVARFQEQLQGTLEVAIGVETAHDPTLALLNKGTTTKSLAKSIRYLIELDISVRVFLLVPPPFMDSSMAAGWIKKSIDFVIDQGVSVISLVPTRTGNGTMETLQSVGQFFEPDLDMIEDMLDYALTKSPTRVLMDLWDLERFNRCKSCYPTRRDRLSKINLSQAPRPRIPCTHCQVGTK